MKKVEVSKEVLEELNELMSTEIFYDVLAEVTENKGVCSNLYDFLFGGTADEADKAQDILEGFLTRDIELVEKEERYVVWIKGSETEDGWGAFMFVGDEDNAIGISIYNVRFDMAKKNSHSHFSKEDAFKLRDTGYFEIERVD